MKRIVAIVLAGLVAVPAAAAQTPAPTVVRFDSGDPPGLYVATLMQTGAGCTGQAVFDDTVPVSAPTFLFAPCRPTLRLSFATPQASVQLMARALVLPATELVARAHGLTGVTLGQAAVADPSSWKPLSLSSPDGAASIAYVDVRAEGANVGVDDLALSARPQPDTSVIGGPPSRTEAGDASFTFGANRPDVGAWRCSLDGAPFGVCTSPASYAGLAAGPHTFRVAAVDGYGAVDASPAAVVWTVLGPPPETQVPAGAQPVVGNGTATLDLGDGAFECSVDGAAFTRCSSPVSLSGLAPGRHTLAVRSVDEDGRADPTPAAWTFDVPDTPSVFPSAVPDVDADRIPDTQELLPLGNVPPIVGERGLARLISGTVYVKLPGLKQLSGFVPLKGVAALPVGTIVDARQGTIGLETAADSRAATDPLRRLSQSRVAAAIFQIRQARQRRPSLRTQAVATQLVLATPPAADVGCRRQPPAKGIVRSLRATAKGLVRVSAGGSFGVGRDATWRTIDRCGSTTTYVTRGIVRVFDKERRRTVTVRAGRRFVVKAQIFKARKGRQTPLAP
ncbi:hypothetical protein OJ998_13400 [Solirubrobacter taibaiensis]|nr:hypothetical protein [Solirubrobacter taibaiensis]